jgi:hypothetical protein
VNGPDPLGSQLADEGVVTASDRSEKQYDVVVVGGSSAGVGAALGAGRLGARVALIEDTAALGGMLANGICNIDAYSIESLSGVFEEFRQGIIEHYRPAFDVDPFFSTPPDQLLDHVDGRSGQANPVLGGGNWEPHVADAVFKKMVAEVPCIDVYYMRFATDVIKNGSRLVGVVTERSAGPHAYAEKVEGERITFLGNAFVDATHEGDIAAWAGAPYRLGREARSRLEPHAGDITFFNGTGEIIGGSGRQDEAIVSAGIRITAQIDPPPNGHSGPLTPPSGYEPARYEHAPSSSVFTLVTVPNGKSEINANPVGNELQELAWAWPEADRAERRRLYGVFREHALGFLYHLQVAEGADRIALPADEFVENGNIPYRLFIREARRIVGEETMTEADVNPFLTSNSLIPPLRTDSIAIGHYVIDVKPVRSKIDMSTPDKGPGDFFLHNCSTAFQVPYGCIVPQEVDGLLVPTALSATHVAFSAVRMDPTWTVVGQAAGVAAALSVRGGVGVRELPIESLQRELIAQSVKLAFYWDISVHHPAFSAVQRLSVRGALSGRPDRTVRPDETLSRAELAELVYHAFELWPSVSEAHFTDVPFDHWAFRYIETLFDNRALEPFGVNPLWPEQGPYDASRHAWFNNQDHDRFGQFLPDVGVTGAELLGVLKAIGEPDVGLPAHKDGCDTVTRGEAFELVAGVNERSWQGRYRGSTV